MRRQRILSAILGISGTHSAAWKKRTLAFPCGQPKCAESDPAPGRGAGKALIGSSYTPMRWLMIALLVSVVALLAASAGLAHHIWQERRKRGQRTRTITRAEDVDIETEEAP